MCCECLKLRPVSWPMNAHQASLPLLLASDLTPWTLVDFFLFTLLVYKYSPSHMLSGRPGGSVVKNPPAKTGGTAVWPLDGDDPLEEELATHCSILAWEIPWTEEPGRHGRATKYVLQPQRTHLEPASAWVSEGQFLCYSWIKSISGNPILP